jgi:Na+/melibiose symporter-like transporter
VAFGIQSFGLNQIMASFSAYIVETIPGQGASTSAAEGFLRQSTAFVLTLLANPLVNTIGPGITCTILAICSAIQCIIMLIIKFKGEKLRKWSGY